MTKLYSKIINEETKECIVGESDPNDIFNKEIDLETGKEIIITTGDFYKSQGFEEREVEQSYDSRWYLSGYCPDKPQSKKEQEVRDVRSEYFDKYVDWYQSKPLYWEELSEQEKQYRGEYREYLKDYTKQEEWWEQNPMTYEEWLVATHPVEE